MSPGPSSDATVAVWYGSVWSRLGRGDLAWAHWDRIATPRVQPWLAAERGQVLRELGLHARAEALEGPALRVATDAADVAMLCVSLVADAVGLGDVDLARRRLRAAADAVGALVDGPRAARQRLRLAWVTVEVALLGGDPPPARDLPAWDATRGEPVQPPDADHGSVFHRAKGLLFGGVVHGDPRMLDAAAALAPPVLAWAVHLARADLGHDADALAAARDAWRAVVVPAEVRDASAATPTARRLVTPA